MTENEQRLAVVTEARRWIGTPYHHHAAVLGAGVDCAQLILEAFAGAGIVDRFEVGKYNHDWHLHRNEERYLETVASYCHRVDNNELPIRERSKDFSCKPGDILVFRVGRTFSHGAIVSRWPNIIHSYFPSRMVEEVSVIGTPPAAKPMRVYSYWGTPE